MAITNATILMRRGNYVDFDPAKMTAGEWAVSIDSDTNKQVVWMCFSAGVVKQMGTYEDLSADVQEMIAPYIESITSLTQICAEKAASATSSEASALNSKNAAASAASSAGQNAASAAASSLSASQSANAATVAENGAESAYQMTMDAISANTPSFSVDFATGDLMYTGGTFIFTIDTTTGNLNWEVAV